MKVVQNFRHIDPQKLRLWLFAGCFLVSLTYLSMTKPYSIRIPTVNSRVSSIRADPTRPSLEDIASTQELVGPQASKLRCNVSSPRSELCGKVDVNIVPKNSSTEEASRSITNQEPTQQLVSNNTIEKNLTSDDSKSVRYGIDDYTIVLKNSTPTATDSTEEKDTSDSIQFDDRSEDMKPEWKPMCDVSDRRSDVCEMDGDIRITGKNSSVIFVRNSGKKESWKIRPYARKADGAAMANVREVFLESSDGNDESPRCTVNHSVPAIVFSDYGYTGNYFHDFTDVLVPLFQTARQFDGEVQFLVADLRIWWIHKYLPIFKMLSLYEIIDYNNDDRVHCFPHAIVGLRSHNDLTIDPSRSPEGYSLVDFTKFMRRTYSLERDSSTRIGEIQGRKPRLLIIARSRTRRFTNLDKIVKSAKKLGYEVLVAENDGRTSVAEFTHVVNSCDVMMGVHGAGLTNLVFLPTNAILIQIVPWGKLEWIAANYFRQPAKDMKLRYLEYSISAEESTLKDLYPRDHPVFKDPMSIHKLGWKAMMEIYLVKQNVKLDVRRFRGVLSKALKLLHQ